MRFSPSFLDDLRSRLTLSDIVGRKVTWDRRKSNVAKGDHWAPCPFHQEKTASFHADDRKGFYHCFGCGAKGDLFTFVMETENLSFAEAVERLAGEAGVELPARDESPAQREAEDRRQRLFDVMEEAVRFYRRAFAAAAGTSARAYAEKRGLTAETIATFELGYAPDGRALAARLAETGQVEAGVEAGLIIVPEEDRGRGRQPFDRFRNRLMFPIRDQRGRCIAFGGRALSADAQAKYLNSPETPLFHKGKTLYNLRAARAAAGKAGTVIVTEGYMDVIALAQAGFAHATAPLGTAMTEDQLQLLWRMAEEPVIALDGDEAGLRAAWRVVDLALPHLAPGRSLGFCLMPEGRDPDDILRDQGPDAMQGVLRSAVPLVEMLWRREVAAGPLDTPERRAAFDKRLREALGRIADPSVRQHYAAAIREMRAELFAAPRRQAAPSPARLSGQSFGQGWRDRGPRRFAMPAGPRPETRGSAMAAIAGAMTPDAAARARVATILLVAWANPAAAAAMAGSIEDMEIGAGELETARTAVLDRLLAGQAEDQPTAPAPDSLTRVPQARVHPFAVGGAPPEAVAAELTDLIERHTLALARAASLAECAAEAASHDPLGADAIDLDDAAPLTPEEAEALRRAVGGAQARLSGPILESARAFAAEDTASHGEDAVRAWQRLLREIGIESKKP